jgi:molecular chaperone GrpE
MGCTMNDAEREAVQAGINDSGAIEKNSGESPPGTTELDELKKTYAELNDRFLRLAADFENFKKRTARERETTIALANERFAVDILEVMDNVERALRADDAHLRKGVEQIHQLFTAQLQRYNINPIDSQKKQFNPAEHESIAHIPSGDATGTIVDVVSPGYRMHDKVIRYAKVAVSNGNKQNQEV